MLKSPRIFRWLELDEDCLWSKEGATARCRITEFAIVIEARLH